MNRLSCTFAVVCCLVQTARAADPPKVRKTFERPISLGELTPTPEMWFYEQALKEYRDPKSAVRRKAEFRAEQRQRRIASMEWFGYSNARPLANADYQFGPPSAQWSSNSSHPLLWRGVSSPRVIYEASTGYQGFR